MEGETPENPPRSVPLTIEPSGALRAILGELDDALCRTVVALQGDLDRLLGPSGPALPDAPKDHLRTMVRVCGDLVGLTHNYLDYTELVQRKRPTESLVTTISTVLKVVHRRFVATAAARCLSWSCAVDGPDATVTTDLAVAAQLLGYLVENAVSYTPEGGSVWVSARAEGLTWVVNVADTGPGIAPEILPRVFEPFVGVPPRGHRAPTGHGLGLAACRAIVDQLGGHVALDTRPGGGTLARVRLPVHDGMPVRPTPPSL